MMTGASLNFRRCANGYMEIKPVWISVKDGLPDPQVKVLAYDTQRIYIAMLPKESEYNEHWIICNEDCSCVGCTGAITHWMPLPLPPE